MPLPKSKKTQKHSWKFSAIGTEWEISSVVEISNQQRTIINRRIEDFDRTYSRFRSDSIVGEIAIKAGEYTLPHSPALFDLYEELNTLTLGAVTPLIGAILEDLGYDKEYSLTPKTIIRKTPEFGSVLKRSGETITTTQPLSLDVGAAGKGLLVDLICSELRDSGHDTFTVDASGDIRAIGHDIETIGLESPIDSAKVIGTVQLTNRALCASATNRRAWGKHHHIIDPRTSEPVKDIIATWVIADTAMLADGLATALFFVAPEILKSRYNYEYVRVHANGMVEYSDYFKGGMF